jgi:threonine dehydratase
MIDPPVTIADGVRTRQPGVLTYAVVSRLADGVVTVTDDQIREATRFMVLRMKTVVEPTGALPAAALMCGAAGRVDNLRVGVIISGGNIDPGVLCDILAG